MSLEAGLRARRDPPVLRRLMMASSSLRHAVKAAASLRYAATVMWPFMFCASADASSGVFCCPCGIRPRSIDFLCLLSARPCYPPAIAPKQRRAGPCPRWHPRRCGCAGRMRPVATATTPSSCCNPYCSPVNTCGPQVFNFRRTTGVQLEHGSAGIFGGPHIQLLHQRVRKLSHCHVYS